jgi:hypothetical protein
VKPALCRTLNLMSLELLANYLTVEYEDLTKLYDELLNDQRFLGEVNEQITRGRRIYQRALFRHEQIDSADWMAIQRIALYILVRLYKPAICLETGVFYGGTTCCILNALRKNNYGHLISIDLPRIEDEESSKHYFVGDAEDMPPNLDVGFLVHPAQKERWTLVRGDSHQEIAKISERIDFYSHDSDHSYHFVKTEMNLVWDKLSENAIMMAHDLDWSNGFYSFCDQKKLYPLIITDNGKSGIIAKTGIVMLGHPMSAKKDVTG